MTHTITAALLWIATASTTSLTDYNYNNTNMARAYSIQKIYATNYETIQWGAEWKAAFGEPEDNGVWFIWGNSGNAKTRFLIELAKEISNSRKLFFNSLEQGNRLTMRNALIDAGVDASNKNFIIGNESFEEMGERLSKHKAPTACVIDTIQYCHGLRFQAFTEMVKAHPKVLFIINSQAVGKNPEGKIAEKIKYDADLKIWVEGFKAISNGRYNPGGEYTIWGEGEAKYWGTKPNNSTNEN